MVVVAGLTSRRLVKMAKRRESWCMLVIRIRKRTNAALVVLEDMGD